MTITKWDLNINTNNLPSHKYAALRSGSMLDQTNLLGRFPLGQAQHQVPYFLVASRNRCHKKVSCGLRTPPRGPVGSPMLLASLSGGSWSHHDGAISLGPPLHTCLANLLQLLKPITRTVTPLASLTCLPSYQRSHRLIPQCPLDTWHDPHHSSTTFHSLAAMCPPSLSSLLPINTHSFFTHTFTFLMLEVSPHLSNASNKGDFPRFHRPTTPFSPRRTPLPPQVSLP